MIYEHTNKEKAIYIVSSTSALHAYHPDLCQICLDLAQVSAFVIVFVLALLFLSCHALLVRLPLLSFHVCHCCTGLLSDVLLLLFTLLFFIDWLPQLSFHFLSLLLHCLAYFHICFHFLSHPCWIPEVPAQPAWLRYKIEKGLRAV